MNKPSTDRDAMTTTSQVFPNARRQSDVQIGPLDQRATHTYASTEGQVAARNTAVDAIEIDMRRILGSELDTI